MRPEEDLSLTPPHFWCNRHGTARGKLTFSLHVYDYSPCGGYQPPIAVWTRPVITLFTFCPRGPILSAMITVSFGATYYYGFFGYSRWGPRSRVQ